MKKIAVTEEVAQALDQIGKDEWTKQFYLISHCKGFSGNGILCERIYSNDLKILESLSPLEFAQCLTVGYEPISQSPSTKVEGM